jgi:Secretory lipase
MSRLRWRGRAALLLGAVVFAGSTAGSAGAAGAAAPLPPQSDPFYQPPSGFGSTAPGTILRIREVSAAAFGALPQKVSAWQLLYRTTDTQGAPEATVTTVLEPDGATPSKSRPLLSYQVAEDSAAPQCAISYQLQQGAGNANIVAQAEILLIDAGLEHGWAVTVPDYEGPKSAYVAGRQAGQAVLDGIRATENFPAAGLDGTRTNVGIWGYSGGALASGWAAELQPGYAPELNLRGVAEGGLPVSPKNVLTSINGGPFAGIAMSGIAGISHAYPDLAQFLDTYLTAAGKAAFAQAATQCNAVDVASFLFTNVYKYFTIPDPLGMPVPKQVLADDTLGQHTPTAPLFVYQSTNDELIPHADVDAVVAKYCGEGAQVTYRRDVLSEHIALVVTGAPDALNWLNDRLSGTAAAAGCHTTTVASSLLSPGALSTLGSVLYHDLLALLGHPIGPGDMA